MSKTELILIQEDLRARKKLLKRFNGDSKRIKELEDKIHAISIQIKRLS